MRSPAARRRGHPSSSPGCAGCAARAAGALSTAPTLRRKRDDLCTPAEVAAGRTIKNYLTGRCMKPYGPTAEREAVMARRIGRPAAGDGGCHGFRHFIGSRA